MMVNQSLGCVLVGDESLLVQCAEILRERGHAIAAIVTETAAIANYAREHAIVVTGWGDSLETALNGIEYDWLFSAANLRIIPDAVWQRARSGAANFHDGPLPRYSGLNAPAWAILEGEAQHGVTWHAIASGIDEGRIYTQQSFPIAPDETALTLNSKCFEAGIATFATLLEQIETGTLAGHAQDLSLRSYFSKSQRPPAAATLQFDQPAFELERLVRGLDFGPGYANPLVTPKLVVGGAIYTVTELSLADHPPGDQPGTVLSIAPDGVTIATADQPVRIKAQRLDDGADVAEVLAIGAVIPPLLPSAIEALSTAVATAAKYETPSRRALASATDLDLMDIRAAIPGAQPDIGQVPVDLPAALSHDQKLAAAAAFLTRLSGQDQFSLAYANAAISQQAAQSPGYFAPAVPLAIAAAGTVADFTTTMLAQLAAARQRGPYLADLPYRYPGLKAPSLSVGLIDSSPTVLPPGAAFAISINTSDSIVFDRHRLTEAHVQTLANRFAILAQGFAGQTGAFDDLPLMDAADQQEILHTWNDTTLAYDPVCMHTLFERQANRTPDAPAVASGDASLTYRQLEDRANRVANALLAHGIGPDVMVGLHVSRSVDLVTGALAILKAGGAYVPLDPMFPPDRLALMIEDSAAPIVLTERALLGRLATGTAKVMVIEDLVEASADTSRPQSPVTPENLAYVIYTSGSTGRPKGVMLEHRNVANFFAGMDQRIPVPTDTQPVWLAVTSLSFDISVLELFWTLARGFKVVIHSSEVSGPAPVASARSLDFGLFYWGNDDGAGAEKYRLLLEGAKFADTHGFNAIWTPERHFHAFGGPYPNPAVTGAAVAAVTKNLSIRAGSCVLPLHHPARVAEEWAVIDNISNGRVGLAFASGWMPEDFLLRPENAPPHNKTALLRDIETVRQLWRGEKVEFDFGSGTVGVITQPRPVQPELPIWVTTAGNPETYRDAARLGANVLTHLLGQSVDELAEKIQIYRQTLLECGRNPADYKVTLMLHTLLGTDREDVREMARQPMKDYLRSATALIKQYAWAFPAFKKPQGVSNPMQIDLQGLAEDELDAIVEFSYLRYFEDSGLFGTIEDAKARIAQITAIGVDEVACLIDFGVPSAIVLERLELLAQVVALPQQAPITASARGSLAEDVTAHGVTHLQCTPSMARMFMVDQDSRRAIGTISHLFIGGEPLPGSLVQQLRTITNASIENMYGPTETTIWSSTQTAGSGDGIVPLGRPIANTQLYVLDANARPVPKGSPGELYIGGDGVARGYHNRLDLTGERFLANPYAPGRYYRTGDLVRFLDDGTLQFLGRADHQVKVRGYRIELGEIEARLAAYPGIAEAVVIAREDRADDVRIVAYLRVQGTPIDEEALRAHLVTFLPHYMVPAHFVTLDVFPLTPNAKVDRKAFPRPDDTAAPAETAAVYVAPVDTIQRGIAETFSRILGVKQVGLSDSFFALGGHSLLAVQAHRELKAGIVPDMAITDLFRFPTVAALAAHLSDRGSADDRLSKVANRAAARRAALGNRSMRQNVSG